MGLGLEDKAALNRLGEQFRLIIRGLLSEMPGSAQTISGFSEWLGVNRSNSQRLLNAALRAARGTDVILALPGVAALEEFAVRTREKGLGVKAIGELEAITARFAADIKRYGRSHADLKRQLLPESEQRPIKFEGGENRRAQHYYASEALLGESTQTLVATHILTEHELRPEFLQEVALVAKLGNQRARHAQPFTQYYSHANIPGFSRPARICANDRLDKKRFSVGIVEDFSSPEVFDAYAGYDGNRSALVFNPIEQSFDASFLFANPDELANPLHSSSFCSSTSISIKNPTRRLIMMVFLDKQLDMRSSVNVGCYSANHSVAEGQLSPERLWSERLPEFPELSVLTSTHQLDAFSAQANTMKDFLFRYTGLNPHQFVGYVMQVEYPIWSSTYRIYFEHSQN